MAIAITTAMRTARVQVILDAIDAGAGPALLRIYDGTRPATGGTVTNLLAELTLSDPAGTILNGVLTLSAITSDSAANATGTATWARIVTSAGTFVCDINVGASGSDLNLNTTSLVVGALVAVSSFTITEGAA